MLKWPPKISFLNLELFENQPMWSDIDTWMANIAEDADDGEFVVLLPGRMVKVVSRLVLRSLGITAYLMAMGFNPHMHWLTDGMLALMTGDLTGLPPGYHLLILPRRFRGAMETHAFVCYFDG